jgi:hypothetical protein
VSSTRVRAGRLARVLGALGLLLALVGCQVKVQVDTKVNADGSGVVSVAVGLDAEAMAKVGDLKSQLQVDDLKAAGWTVTGPTREADGFSWVRASKPFADGAEATAVMNEVNGPNGAFRDWKVTHSSSAWSTSWTVTGTVDLSRGAATFTDSQLDRTLGANGYQDAIEQLVKGQPVSKAVDVRVSVEVPGSSKVYAPTFAAHQTTAVHVSTSRFNRGVGVALLVVGLAVLGLALVLLRSRYARHHSRPHHEPQHAA